MYIHTPEIIQVEQNVHITVMLTEIEARPVEDVLILYR